MIILNKVNKIDIDKTRFEETDHKINCKNTNSCMLAPLKVKISKLLITEGELYKKDSNLFVSYTYQKTYP